MTEIFTVRGLPRSLAKDGWWLEESQASAETGSHRHPGPRRTLSLLSLIALADVLFWDHEAGLSLAVFAFAVFGVAALTAVRPIRGPLAILVLGALPVVDLVQPLSVAFLTGGLLCAVVWLRLPGAGMQTVLSAALRLLSRLPCQGVLAMVRRLRRISLPATDAGSVIALLRNWAFPVGGTVVFASLLMDANPVVERIFSLNVDPGDLVDRSLFWAGVGLMLWPVLEAGEPATSLPQMPRLPRLGINAVSTLRALWMFNLLIGVQTFLDLMILLGGAALPEGMTHAEYAHRGAYPLLVTALLAGAFALAARPYLAEHRALKPLMMLWLLQNVALSLSAALRLHLYIEAYGLTYLRIHALIWMALVALGLALALYQVWRGKSNAWLLLRGAMLAGICLYLCAFVNFAAVIAQTNLARKPAAMDYADWRYLGDLGPLASAEIVEALAKNPDLRASAILSGFEVELPEPQGWREWGFRKARVLRYLANMQQPDRRP